MTYIYMITGVIGLNDKKKWENQTKEQALRKNVSFIFSIHLIFIHFIYPTLSSFIFFFDNLIVYFTNNNLALLEILLIL